MIYQAGSGHAGGSLSVLDILIALYYDVIKKILRILPGKSVIRVILSKGHACPGSVAILADLGYFPKGRI